MRLKTLRQSLRAFDPALKPVPLHLVDKAGCAEALQRLGGDAGDWAAANGFEGAPGQLLIVPGKGGAAAAALFVWLARDLVNTPANDLGPDGIEAAARAVAKPRKMTVKVVKGGDLLKQNFPLIHAVGRASAQAPRLIDMRWGKRGAPRLTLVGKGVAFDTGGLDIKPPSGMR
jgi:hypothetical protein